MLRKEGRRLFYGMFLSEVRLEFVLFEIFEFFIDYVDNRRLVIGV